MTKDTQQNPNQQVSDDDKKPFVSYYNEHSIIPVSQDTDDPDFIFKRNSLHKLLGIPLSTLTGRDILEFGPGGGYNAIATSHYQPRLYVFVDASKASISELKHKHSCGLFGAKNVEIIESNIFDFKDPRDFHLVVIEGVIPGQTKPEQMLRHAASFVSEGGFLTTTTNTGASFLSEVCRRLFRPFIFQQSDCFKERVSEAVKIFEPHLKTLNTKTRPPKDWVLDNIIQDWGEGNRKHVFSILDCIKVLGDSFDFYSSSPKFLIDDRFYKKIDSRASKTNLLVKQQFSQCSLAFLDYRVPLVEVLTSKGSVEMEFLCKTLFDIHVKILESNNYESLDLFLENLKNLCRSLPLPFADTTRSIDEFVGNFPKFVDGAKDASFEEFAKWWGRGQQYVSFVRTKS